MDPKTILRTIKEASPFDLFLISFLLLPFVFDAWVDVLEKLKFGLCAKYWSLGFVLAGYIVGVILMLVGNSRKKSREIARDQIIHYLTANDFEMMSYGCVRQNINRAFSDDFLETLIISFPNDLRKARLRGAKPGIARIIESNVDDEA